MPRNPLPTLLLSAGLVTLLLAAAPTEAASPAPLCLDDSAASTSKNEPELDSFCEVDCGATTISVNCNGQCEGVDRNCNIGQRGRVKCNGVTTSVCPACPVQSCTTGHFCPDGTFIQCTSSSGDCEGFEGLCYVRCDSNYTWCPGHMFEDDCFF